MLATGTRPAHNGAVHEAPSFTFNVEPDPLRDARFRWTVREGTQIRLRSPHAYATKDEATLEAAKAAKRLSEGERDT